MTRGLLPLLLLAAAACGDAGAGVFSRLSYEHARAAAAAADKFFLVDGMARWCGPCKRMDRETWRDPRVREWLRREAVAYQLDYDREKDIALRLRISALPTLILMRGDKVLARVTGYQGPEQLLRWLGTASKAGS